jgi:hypothetical protein
MDDNVKNFALATSQSLAFLALRPVTSCRVYSGTTSRTISLMPDVIVDTVESLVLLSFPGVVHCLVLGLLKRRASAGIGVFEIIYA